MSSNYGVKCQKCNKTAGWIRDSRERYIQAAIDQWPILSMAWKARLDLWNSGVDIEVSILGDYEDQSRHIFNFLAEHYEHNSITVVGDWERDDY